MKWHPAQTFSLAHHRDVARAFELALTGAMDRRILNIADAELADLRQATLLA
jgi:nucleoside-diphosphate-sugar epimerase